MKTILIVDDDENDCIILERALSEEGYTIRSVNSGIGALVFVDKNPQLDLIILDVQMPSMDGIEVLKQLRGKGINIPVILYSNYPFYKNDFVSQHAQAYLIKDFDHLELKKKVRALLSSKS